MYFTIYKLYLSGNIFKSGSLIGKGSESLVRYTHTYIYMYIHTISKQMSFNDLANSTTHSNHHLSLVIPCDWRLSSTRMLAVNLYSRWEQLQRKKTQEHSEGGRKWKKMALEESWAVVGTSQSTWDRHCWLTKDLCFPHVPSFLLMKT